MRGEKKIWRDPARHATVHVHFTDEPDWRYLEVSLDEYFDRGDTEETIRRRIRERLDGIDEAAEYFTGDYSTHYWLGLESDRTREGTASEYTDTNRMIADVLDFFRVDLCEDWDVQLERFAVLHKDDKIDESDSLSDEEIDRRLKAPGVA